MRRPQGEPIQEVSVGTSESAASGGGPEPLGRHERAGTDVAAGQETFDGSGGLNGTIDENNGGVLSDGFEQEVGIPAQPFPDARRLELLQQAAAQVKILCGAPPRP